jgi:hypothetical protein
MGTAIHVHAENVKLQEENKRLRAGIKAVRELINQSSGVDGLHMNGDIAEWGELEQGGNFEGWLLGFNEAEYAM